MRRLYVWIAALALDYAAPWHGFALPAWGERRPAIGRCPAGHLAERNRLVLLIGVRRVVLAIGASFAELDWSARVVAAIVIGFVATVSLWWTYFVGSRGGGRTRHRGRDGPDPRGPRGLCYATRSWSAA